MKEGIRFSGSLLDKNVEKIPLDRLHIILYTLPMDRKEPLQVVFFETENGNQPVRDFILGLTREDRKEIGSDIFTVQKGFPLGLPLVEKLDIDLWEIRSHISGGICRIFLLFIGKQWFYCMVLLKNRKRFR